MPNQELFQFYNGLLRTENNKRQIRQWWTWIRDFGKLESLPKNDAHRLLEEWTGQLSRNYPIQYIFQRAYFYDLALFVNEHVLIPRPETEELIHWVHSDGIEVGDVVLDMGTGSGAIPLALKKLNPEAEFFGCDVSPQALEVAQRNAETLSLEVDFFDADLFRRIDFPALRQLDIMICNPPYIDSSETLHMTLNTQFEPPLALFAPTSVLEVYIAVAQRAMELLKPSGRLYVEINEFYASEIESLFSKMGYQVLVRKDMQGKDRMLRAIKS